MMERCLIYSYLGHSFRLAKAGLKQLIASAGCLHDATKAYQEHVHAVKQVHLFIYLCGDATAAMKSHSLYSTWVHVTKDIVQPLLYREQDHYLSFILVGV